MGGVGWKLPWGRQRDVERRGGERAKQKEAEGVEGGGAGAGSGVDS